MNITSDISSTNESNSFTYSVCNNTVVENDFNMESVAYIMTILLSFPINSYVIWLIVRGTGNGLAAEIFILNFSVCETLYCVDCLLAFTCYTFETCKRVVDFLDGLPITGRPLLQSLICVERYLAVIHPVTFLKYKPLRYRLMCCTAAWVTCLIYCIYNCITMFFVLLHLNFLCFVAQYLLFLSIQMFCCLAVLRALKQSGPGERGREREEENQMKSKAFYLILITTVNTFITYSPQITLEIFSWYSNQHSDVLVSIGYICYIFAGLVQPILFLYRVGKLNFIKCH